MYAYATQANQQEKMISGAVAAGMHLLFLALLVFGVNWQRHVEPPVNIVDLWPSASPAPPQVAPAPEPPAPPPPPEVKPPEPKVAEPVPAKAAPRPEPAKPDIAIKDKLEKEKRAAEEKQKDAKKKEEEAQKAQAAEAQRAANEQAEAQRRAAEQAASAQAKLIGQEGKGFKYILDGMNAERILVSSEAIGDARWFTKTAVAYVSERRVFDRPIGQNQAVQFPIARAHAEAQAADLVLRRAAARFDAGLPCGDDANMGKLLASEATWHAAEACL